jgi:hypothetical protein
MSPLLRKKNRNGDPHAAMVLSIRIVVDDAIVVLENIERLMEGK